MLPLPLPRPFPHSLARREREALCDLALEVGAAAPTLCEGWTVKDLIVHLLLRERRPWTAAGALLPALAGTTARVRAGLADRDLASLVAQLRAVPLPVAVVDPLVNGVEMFVHHEDVRRGTAGWVPRRLPAADEATLWRAAAGFGRLLVRPAGVPVEIRSGARRAVLRGGASPAVVEGPVPELVLFLFGRAEVTGLTFSGPEEHLARLRSAKLGI